MIGWLISLPATFLHQPGCSNTGASPLRAMIHQQGIRVLRDHRTAVFIEVVQSR